MLFRLEELERRETPATLTWTGAGVNNLWSNPSNWLGGAPNASSLDDLVFPTITASSFSNMNNDIANLAVKSITINQGGYVFGGAQSLILGSPLVSSSGNITVNNGVGIDIQFNLQLAGANGGQQFLNVNSGTDAFPGLIISGQISGGAGSELTKTGVGSLTLANNNTGFTGQFTIGNDAGIVRLTNAGALGATTAGTTLGQNAQILLDNVVGGAILEPITLNATGGSNDGALRNFAGNNVWAGNIAFGSIGSTVSINVQSGSTLEISGQITDQAVPQNLNKRGSGTLILSPTNGNTYRGVTTIENGLVRIRHPQALGTADGTPNTGTFIRQDSFGIGGLQLDGAAFAGGGFVSANEYLVLNGSGTTGLGALHNFSGNNDWTGTVILGDNTAPVATGAIISIGVQTATELTITGTLNDRLTGNLRDVAKIGTGKLILPTANPNFTRLMSINAGVIGLRDSQGLGAPVTDLGTSVSPGAALHLEVDGIADSITGDTRSLRVAEILGILGSGIANTGALRSVSGVNTYIRPLGTNIITSVAAVIGVDKDPIQSATDAYFTNDYSLTITGGIGGGTLTKVGEGHLILPNANGYTSTTTISQGWVTIRDVEALGAFSAAGYSPGTGDTASPAITVQNNASLHLMPLTAKIVSATWSAGIVTVTTATQHGFTSQQSAVIAGMGPAGYNGTFTISPGLGNTFSYPLAVDPGVATTFGTVALNFNFTRNLILDGIGNTHAYSLISQKGAIVSLGGDNIIGGPYAYSPTNIRTSDIKLNNNVGIGVERLPSFAAGSLVITGQMHDGTVAGGFTKFGSRRLTIQNANSYTGAVVIQEGVLRAQHDYTFGQPGGGVTVQNAGASEIQQLVVTGSAVTDAFRLTYDGVTHTPFIPFNSTAATLQNILNNTPSLLPAGASVTVHQSGNTYYITFGGTLGNGINANPLQVSGLVGGATAAVTTLIEGDGVALELKASLPLYNGGISAGLQIWGERLTIKGNIGNSTLGAIDSPLTISPGEDHLWRGPVSLDASATITIPQTSRLTLFGTIDDAGNTSPSGSDINFIGGGALSLFGANTFRGNTFVNQGIVTIENAFALGTTGVQEVQTVTLPGTVATWNLTFNGVTTTPDFTAASTASDVQTALQALTTIGGIGGTATVTKTGSVFTITFGGTLSGFNQPTLTATVVTGSGTIAVATPTQGSGATIVANGAQLQLQGGITVAGEPLLLNGDGVDAPNVPNIPLRWFQTGPAAIANGQTTGNLTVSGRVTSVTVDPTDEKVIYITSAGGGAWKTTNNGITWTPLFDRQDLVGDIVTIVETSGTVVVTTATPHGYLTGQTVVISGASVAGYNGTFRIVDTPSATTFRYVSASTPLAAGTGGLSTVSTKLFAGSIVVAPTNPHVLYLGTGEGNNTGDSYYGTGVYKSIDSGLTWRLLTNTFNVNAPANPLDRQVINKIIVDPGDQDRIYVASSDRSAPPTLQNQQLATAPSTQLKNLNIVAATWNTGVATLTTEVVHDYLVGDSVRITGMTPTGYNGVYTVTAITGNTLSYSLATDPGLATVFGTVAHPDIIGATWSAGVATITTGYAHGYVVGDTVRIIGMTPTAYNGSFVITAVTAKTLSFALAANPLVITAASYAALSQTATVTTATPHGFVTGQQIVVSGMTPAGYNGTFFVTSTLGNTFSYRIATDPGGAATGFGTAAVVRGDFELAITNATWSAGSQTVTVTTSKPHGFQVGQQVAVSGMFGAGYNGTFIITAAASTTFNYRVINNPGLATTFGTAKLIATAPGVWRYDSSGAWVNLTGIVSPSRTSIPSSLPGAPISIPGAAIPGTPGPDDNYQISFPQSNASWSDIALAPPDVDGNRWLYAALGTSFGLSNNAVFRLREPQANVSTVPFMWLVGDPINGPDTRNVGWSNPVNEIQTITVSPTVTSFQLRYNDGAQPPVITSTANITYTGVNGTDINAIQSALNAMFNGLTAGNFVTVTSTAAHTFRINFNGGALAGANHLPLTSTLVGGTGTISVATTVDGGPFNSPSQGLTAFPLAGTNANIKISAVNAPVNEVQRITISGAVSDFRLTYNGNETAVITPSAGNIATALNQQDILGPWIGTDGVTVTPVGGGFDVTFRRNSVGGANVLQMDVTQVNGGGTVTVTTTTQGSGPTVYAAVSNTTGNLVSIQKTVDGGRDWQSTALPTNYLNTQGNTDNVILAQNANTVYIGGAFNGVDNARNFVNSVLVTTDGGATWSDLTSNTALTSGTHAGQHGMTFDRTGRLLVANDGGIWRLQTATPGTVQWNSLNGNLAISQVNGVAQNPTNLNAALAGANDNGTSRFSGVQRWTQTDVGDGGLVAYDPKNPNVAYHVRNIRLSSNIVSATIAGNVATITTPSPHGYVTGESVSMANILDPLYNGSATITSVPTPTTFTYTIPGPPTAASSGGTVTANFNTSLMKSLDGGATWTSVLDGTSTYFPFAIDSNNPSRIVVGLGGVFETVNGGTRTPTGGTTFTSLNQPLAVTALALATYQGTFNKTGFPNLADKGANAADPDTIYVTNGTQVSVTKDHGVTWVDRSPPGVGIGTIFDIKVDPANRDTVYVTLQTFAGRTGRHVLKSIDAGLNWFSVSDGLPDVATYRLAIDPRTNDVYVGNDIGIYKLTGGVGTWTRFGDGLPNVQIKDLVLSPELNILSAGTYGRSMYQFYLNDARADSGALRAVAGNNTWTGPIRLGMDTVITVNGSQALQSGLAAAQLNVVGVISDATYQGNFKLTKDGQGDAIFSGTNTYGGLTEIKSGVLIVQNPQALGDFRPAGADITAQGGTIVNPGTALLLRSDLALEGVQLNGNGATQANQHNTGALRNISNNNTFTGTLYLNTNTTIGVDGGSSLTIGTAPGMLGTGTINGAFGFDKELTGTLTLNSANTYTGVTNVNQGILQIQNSAALGTTAGGTFVLDGAQLLITAPAGGPVLNVGNENLHLSGTGINNGGALVNSAGDNTWGGRVTFDYLPGFFPVTAPPNFVSINVATGTSLTLNGVVDEDTTRPGSPIAFGLTKIGGGRLNLTQANTYSEQTNIVQGVINISNSNALGTFGPGVSPPNPLIHDYQLNVDLADALGGPSLQAVGTGSFLGGHYNFARNEGLSLSNALPNPANYTIEMRFYFTDLVSTSWTRILDFANRTDDDGLYQITNGTNIGALQFWNPSVVTVNGTNNVFTPNVDIHVAFARNATTKQVFAYVNGLLAFSFIDTEDEAIFSGPNNIIHFFTDNITGGSPGEASPGGVDFIRIYNATLTAPQVLTAFQGGTVTLGAVTKTDTIVHNDAALELSGGINVPAEALTLNGAGIANTGALLNVSGQNTYAGSVLLQTSTHVGANANTQVTLTGVVSDPTPTPAPAPVLTKVGTGTVVLTNANTFHGETFVNAGVLNIQNNTALGINSNEVQRITVTGTSGSYTITFDGQITSPLLPGMSAAQVQSALNALSSINAGGGSVSVTQAGNVYTITFDGGPLSPFDQTPLTALGINGTTVAVTQVQNGGGGGTTVASGATLQVQNGITVASESLTLNGVGFNNVGAIQNISGTNTWQGPVILASNASIGSTGVAPTDKLILSTSISQSSPGLGITKVGPGVAQYAGNTANTYTGLTNVFEGLLELNKSILDGAIAGNLTVGNVTPINEIQTLNIPATVTSFSLTFNGNTTGAITYTGTAATDIAAISFALNLPAILGVGGSVVVTSTAPNTFTITFGGTLAGANQPLITANLLAGTGPITTGPTINGAPFTVDSDVVRLLQANQIANTSAVIVQGDGFLDLNGFSDQFASLTMHDGHVKINNVGGVGSLTVPSLNMTGGLIDNAGAGSFLNLTGSVTATSSTSNSATVTGASGTINLNGSAALIGVNDGPRDSDFVVGNSVIGVAGVTKSGVGRMEIISGGSVTMPMTITTGDVQVDAGATANDIILNGVNSSISGGGTVGRITGAPSPTGAAVGTVNPGLNGTTNSTAILNSSDVVWGPTTTFFVNLDNPNTPLTQPVAGTEYDQLNITGNADLGGASLSGLVGLNVQLNDSFTILKTTGQISGQLSGVLGATSGLIPQDGIVFVGGVKFTLHYDYSLTNGSVVLTRVPATATAVITANPGATTVFGQLVSFTVTVTPEAGASLPSSGATVAFSIDGGAQTTTLPLVVSGGVGTATLDPQTFFSIVWAGNSTHTIDATVAIHGYVAPTVSTFTQTVNKADTSINLTAAPSPSTYGNPILLTAVVTAVSPGAGGPSNGVLNFYVDSVTPANLLGAGVLSGNTYTYTTGATQISIGTHSIIAVFASDTNLLNKTETITDIVVTKATTAITSVTTGGSLVFGAPMSLNVVVTATSAGSPGSPVGTVSVLDTTTGLSLGTGSVTPLTATTSQITFNFTAPSAVLHDLTITFTGTPIANANFANSSTTSSFTIAKADTAVALTSTVPIGAVGVSTIYRATVTTQLPSTGAVNNGTVTFTNSTTGQTLGTSPVTLVAGVGTATLSSTLNTPNYQLGANAIVATYNPPVSNPNFNTSTSASFSQQMKLGASMTYAAVPASPSLFGQTVNVTVTVAGTGVAPPIATGSVSIFEGPTLLAAGTLSGASVTIPLVGLTLGTHNLTVIYNGDVNYAPNTLNRTQVVAQSPTTTAVTSNSPVQFGQASIFTATVSASFGGAPTLGIVTFFDNNVAIGSGSFVSSNATSMTYSFSPIAPLSVGTHNVTARYTGSTNFLASTSTNHSHTVAPSNTTTTLAATAPSQFGQFVTFNAQVASTGGITPSGTVTFFDGVTAIGTTSLDIGGNASLTISTLSTTVHTITAVYNSTTNFATSTSNAVTHTVNRADTSTTVTSNAVAGAVYGQVVTFTITVTATSGGLPGAPTGTVNLFDGVTPLAANLALVNGVATFSITTPLSVANHAITAVYGTTTDFNTSTSAAFSQNVTSAATTTTLTSTPTFWALNEPVTFTATVAANSPSIAVPTGTVTFIIDGVPQAPVALNASGQASLVVPPFTPSGNHTVSVQFNNDNVNFTASAAPAQTQNVRLRTDMILATSMPEGALENEAITFFALVTGAGGGVPTGQVNFFDNGVLIGTGNLNANGVATLTLAGGLTIGNHNITAQYVGDSTFNPAVPANSLTQVVIRTRIKGRLIF